MMKKEAFRWSEVIMAIFFIIVLPPLLIMMIPFHYLGKVIFNDN